MLRIRLFRAGKKNQPFFKVVVIEKRSPPKGGRPLEILGFYNPLTKEKNLKKERIQHWLSVGAQPSDTVYNLLVAGGVLKGKKKAVHSTKKSKRPSADKAKPAEAKPAEAKPVEAKPEKPKPEKPKPDEAKPEKPKPDEAKSEKPKPEKPKPEGTKGKEL